MPILATVDARLFFDQVVYLLSGPYTEVEEGWESKPAPRVYPPAVPAWPAGTRKKDLGGA